MNINSKVVLDSDICDGYPSRKISRWFSSDKKFKQIVNDFKPDIILVDRQKHFAQTAVNSDIPVLVHLRGDFWSEIKWAKETIYKGYPKNKIINKAKTLKEAKIKIYTSIDHLPKQKSVLDTGIKYAVVYNPKTNKISYYRWSYINEFVNIPFANDLIKQKSGSSRIHIFSNQKQKPSSHPFLF